jgi:hypothetical protein
MPAEPTAAGIESTLLVKYVASLRHRAFVRYPCQADCGATSLVSAIGAELAWAVNLSLSGIGLRLSRHLDLDTPVLVRVHGLSCGAAREFAARVVHCTPQGPGVWLVGCQFNRQLDSQELKTTLKEIGG